MALLKDIKQYSERGQTFTGVFYLEHETRRYGVGKDKQLILRYTITGKTRTETLGWLSEGYTAQDAQNQIKVFRSNAKAGIGATSLTEERTIHADNRKTEESVKQLEIRRNITLGEYFNGDYLDAATENKKGATVVSEKALFKKWIKPTMGSLRIKDIVPLDFHHLESGHTVER